ncbi:MAG: metabolite traffic protein EboE [Gemmatimonadota bacterium]
MRVGPGGRAHLSYCTNIHPGEDWAAVRAELERFLPPLRGALSPDEHFGVGLRLSARAARELRSDLGALSAFRGWLDAQGLYVFTMNGFPYGGFHRGRVKDRVYAPDWRTRERVEYTLELAHLLVALLPAETEGGISTSPISYKPWLDPGEWEDVLAAGARHLAEVAVELAGIHETKGTIVHVDIEPEPDCLIENGEETVRFFQEHLFREGREVVVRGTGLTAAAAEELLRRHIRVCYDTCHFAVQYEDPAEALDRFEAAGIAIGKVQLSAALATPMEQPHEVARALRPFAEGTYLHQVVERTGQGGLRRYRDLPEALSLLERSAAGTDAREWRVHYHVPLFTEGLVGGLRSTRKELEEALRLVMERGLSDHLEVETYTWEVLPDELKTDLGTSIRQELAWVLARLDALGTGGPGGGG